MKNDVNAMATSYKAQVAELGFVLELDYNMNEDDYATTDSGHVIKLNAAII